mmetsp:Transcript_18656/g.34765  ORF Transcript_18656/g.34765 Transcript_18656/m.34765 type:complete len:210 (+) Transcript_18656:624-1253(+)
MTYLENDLWKIFLSDRVGSLVSSLDLYCDSLNDSDRDNGGLCHGNNPCNSHLYHFCSVCNEVNGFGCDDLFDACPFHNSQSHVHSPDRGREPVHFPCASRGRLDHFGKHSTWDDTHRRYIYRSTQGVALRDDDSACWFRQNYFQQFSRLGHRSHTFYLNSKFDERYDPARSQSRTPLIFRLRVQQEYDIPEHYLFRSHEKKSQTSLQGS